jgi:NAD+ synthase (glutamine-hydrolysing)
MAQLRVALVQVDTTVGDLAGNASTVLDWARHAAGRGAHLALFPEMALTGYPPEDLVLRRSFVEASRRELHRLAERLADAGLGEMLTVVGYLDTCPHPTPRVGRPAGEPQNVAAFLHGGRVVATYAKHHLPNYGVFDEFRYFVPGDRLPVLRLHGVDIAVVVCEDLWQEGGPVVAARAADVGLLACINASPYERAKEDFRVELVRRRAAEAGAMLAYVNMVGGQDELVFDGDSLVVSATGGLLARAPQFGEGCLLVDVEVPAATTAGPNRPVDVRDGSTMLVERTVLSAEQLRGYPPERSGCAPRLGALEEIYTALVIGTRDYVRKNGFRSVVIGLSGGIDSALTATVATDALGPKAVHVVGLPSRYSTEHSLTDAEELAHRQRLDWCALPIADVVDAYDKALAAAGGLHGIAEENLQARVRGTILMGLSNQFGHLVLTTGNKSELATGFSTLYGDSAGGFAPLKDVPKTLVWQLARWRNDSAVELGETPPIPENSITKPPSAELAPGQFDADRLPDYQLLDAVLEAYVDEDLGRADLVGRGFDPEVVDRVVAMVDAAEYKRRQYPPGPKITVKAFGRDRRLPITNRWREPVATDAVTR